MDKSIFLITQFAADGTEAERLVEAATRNAALHHCIALNKASAADVARVLGADGKVEKVEA